jgi:hypothetical protein
MFIKKFYDAEAVEGTAAPAQTSTPSLASMMASGGVMNSSESMVATPFEIKTENNEKPVEQTIEATPAVTATEQKEETQVVQETPVKEAPVFGLKPQTEDTQVQGNNWQEVLKNQQPEAVLKELGFDEKMVSFINHWKNGGDVKEYLREMSVDYTAMPSEDVMKHQLRKEYPKASDKAIELLYQEEVVEKYKLDADIYSELEVERGRLLLDTKVERIREQLAKDQQNFLLSAPAEKPVVQDPQQVEREQALESHNKLYIETMSKSELTSKLLSESKYTYGEGDSKFSYPVDTNKLTETLLDMSKFQEAIFDKVKDANGKEVLVPNVKKQWLVSMIANYGENFLDEFAKHNRALGARKLVEPIENPSKSENSVVSKTQIENLSPAAAMARGGIIVG